MANLYSAAKAYEPVNRTVYCYVSPGIRLI